MSSPPADTLTALLHAAHDGDAHAFDQLVDLIYDELHRLARIVRGPGVGATLNTTALVHEAYLRLVPSRDLAWQDRTHFFRIAARAMRQVIVRAAEHNRAQKRGGGQVDFTFDENIHAGPLGAEDILELDEALERLGRFAPRQAQIVECRFFAGLTVDETATALGLGTATVKRDWRSARAWLSQELR